MADRVTRSAARATGSIPDKVIAQPFCVSKRKLKKDLTDEEKEEVKKHEIKGKLFPYRLKSIREILNEMHDDTNEKTEGGQRKKRRPSSIKRGGRRSIVQSSLVKNEVRNEEKEKNNNEESSVQEAATESANNVHEEKCQNEIIKETKCDEPLIAEQEDAQNSNQVIKEKPIEEDNMEVDIEETEEQKQEATKKRQQALETLEKLQSEQMEWAKLLKKHQVELSEEQISSTSVEEGKYFLSKEQREFLENRINADEFLDRLQHQAEEFSNYMEYIMNFASKLKQFKENTAQYLKQQTEQLVRQEFEIGKEMETPRRLITKITKSETE